MTDAKSDHSNSFVRVFGCLSVVLILGGILAVGIIQLREEARLSFERSKQQWRQKEFDSVKRGDSSALVMDSKLLPMLATDSDCQKNVTRLDFASTEIDSDDALYIAELPNITSMTFYCTQGTKHALRAAGKLPITDLYFEMPDLPVESYLMLKDFPHLKKVRFEQVMEDEWIERLKSELQGVNIDTPFPRSQEPVFAR
jgi:hypothetical protein